jgi:hypothetical protein
MALRISLDKDADREDVAQAATNVLTDNNARPSRLGEAESLDALSTEEWRDIERINELSTIEFRTVSVNRLKQYAIDEKMNPEAINELVQIAERTWDDHLKTVDPKVPPHKADWNSQCHSVALAFIENAKHLLSEKQMEQLKEMVRIEMPQ